MTYIELLQQNEWHQKCQEILDRDKFHCQDCGSIGFHGGCHLPFNTFEDIDQLFDSLIFNDESFSSCLEKTLTKSKRVEINDIKFELKGINDGIRRYRIDPGWDLLSTFVIEPIVTSDLMDEDLLSINRAMSILKRLQAYYRNNNVLYGLWLIVFEFDQLLSKQAFLTIQYNPGYVIDEAAYDKTLISITIGNRLICLILPPDIMKGLNIHHKYYIRGKEPWEYTNDALVTLCEDCHKKRHQTTSIPMLDSQLRYIKDMQICDRCGGSGYLPQYHHVENGICFKCGGEGIILDDGFL